MSRHRSDSELSGQAVVIGAGIVGLSSAFWLQEHGFDVTLIDPEPRGAGASWGNACTLASYGCIPIATSAVMRQLPRLLLSPESPLALRWSHLPRMLPWLLHFIGSSRRRRVVEIAAALASLLDRLDEGYAPLLAASGTGDLFSHRGVMYLYGSERAFESARADTALRQANGVEVQVLDRTDITDLEPQLAPLCPRGLLFPGGYSLRDPRRFVDRLFDTVIARGGRHLAGRALAVARQEQGLAVSTDNGRLRAGKVVVAAGAWCGALMHSFGDHAPLDTERGYHVGFAGQQGLISRPVGLADSGFYMAPLHDGLRAAGTVELGGLRAPPNRARMDLIERQARRLLPQLEPRSSDWFGFRPSMPDSMPVIDRSPNCRNLIYAFGHGHLGLSLGGITGKLVAELAADAVPSIDLAPFRIGRF